MNTPWRITLALLIASISTLGAGFDFTLDVFGNANMDDIIDEKDIDYLKNVIGGSNPATNLSDANYDGEIDGKDIERIEQIIHGEETELSIVDAMGRTITVQVPLERVVVFSSYGAEAMRAIGVDLDETIIGAYDFMVNRSQEYFPEISDKANVGSTTEIDYEKIAEVRPEVVIFYPSSTANINEEAIEAMGAVVLYENTNDPENIYRDLRKLGMMCQKEEEAETLIEWHQNYEELIVSRTSQLSPDDKQSAFFYSFPEYYKGTDIYSTINNESVNHQNMNLAGVINIAADLPVKNPRVSPEWIMVQNPDVIIGQIGDTIGYAAEESVIEELKEVRDGIRNITGIGETKASKENRIFFVSRDILSGVDNVVALAYIAKYAYPELFEDVDPVEIHKEYLQFQGMKYRGIWAYPPIS